MKANSGMDRFCILHRGCLALFVGLTLVASVQAQRTVHELDEALVIRRLGTGGRTPVHTDTLEHALVTGRFEIPSAGQVVRDARGEAQVWEKATANEDGELIHRAFRGGYCFWRIETEKSGLWILEATGHSMVYVNGTPRAGDPYRYGIVKLPVWLERGENDLLFSVSRGRLKARLVPMDESVILDETDATLPDLIRGRSGDVLASLLVVNASREPLADLRVRVNGEPVSGENVFADAVLPLSARKVGFRFPSPGETDAAEAALDVALEATRGGETVTAETQVKLAWKDAKENHKVTFRSKIEGSVQYYAVNPARGRADMEAGQALVLSVHGAGVEAMNQVNAYSGKSWAHIVAPTNRRRFGFDWEDWGRLDALEVLQHASQSLAVDSRRVYLTGHSMGGHGTWQLGAHFPDRFAAIGPSAGWISFSTYGRRSRQAPEVPSPMDRLLARSRHASDTLLVSTNYLQQAVYIIHGDADRSVPVREARAMREHLKAYHPHVQYHEQAEAGHWWGDSDEPGSECVDWPPLFDLYARTRIPAPQEVRRIHFTTVNPALSDRCQWVRVTTQEHSMQPGIVDLQWDPWKGRIVGTSENVLGMELQFPVRYSDENLLVELDGQTLEVKSGLGPEGRGVMLQREDSVWKTVSQSWGETSKNPDRAGPFKEAFRRGMIFVYGTAGSADENQWAREKARFDAETFWYRGNGSIEVVSDRTFLSESSHYRDRAANVILFGNLVSNRAAKRLLAECPIRVNADEISVGEKQLRGSDMTVLLTWPHPKHAKNLVALVGGTGIVGMKLANQLPYFVSGVAYPDWMIMKPAVLHVGNEGIVGAGFFDARWRLSDEDSVWQ